VAQNADNGARIARFGPFEADLQTQELRKSGRPIWLAGQSFVVLKMLLEKAPELVTREELQAALWPDDTFVDFEHGLNAAVNKLRETRSDSAEEPKYIETLPRRGYRFIGELERVSKKSEQIGGDASGSELAARAWWKLAALTASVFLLAGLGAYLIRSRPIHSLKKAHALTRLTFDAGLQSSVTWSPDSRFIAYSVGSRGGRSQLWEMSLVNSQMNRIAADDHLRDSPLWSPDAKRLVSFRYDFLTHDVRWVLWSPETRTEELIPDSSLADVTDWSPDGASLLVSRWNEKIQHTEIWLLPIAAAANASPAGRLLISEGAYDLGSAQFSSDGRWIVFQATRNLPSGSVSKLYVTLTSGGPWIPLTDGKYWDGRPHWSPNRKTIYFVSDRSSFYSNVWGIHFDPARGKPQGGVFAVTKFESPALMVPWHTPSVQFSLTQDHLVLTMEQVSGSIWMLENMDQ
jgi:DNA-binding winged helix-turn-helix (wHTH) protein